MKHWQRYLSQLKPQFLETQLPQRMVADMIVVIPCLDEKDLNMTLQSLLHCEKEGFQTLVVIILNSSERSPISIVEQNRKSFDETIEFANKNRTPDLDFFPLIFENLPRKHAGVGLARKIGMDLAVSHFHSFANSEGIIVSLDADCTVWPHFLSKIYRAYKTSAKLNCTVQNFSHRVENNDARLENAIRQYEQYIGYYSRMLRFIGFPYYYHTIGSAFSVAADAYVRVGGMGRQQGGEDFYFLQKIFALGNVEELTDVFVYPMARFSDRVPFGTGPALRKIMDESGGEMTVYSRQSFRELSRFFVLIDTFFKQEKLSIEGAVKMLHPSIARFIEEINFWEEIEDCNQNSATQAAFRKRFFHHFNGFKIIKYLNFAHSEYFSLEKISVVESVE